MIKKVEMHVSEHILDEDDGPGEQSINVNLFVQALGATPTEKAAIRTIMNAAQLYINTELKNLK
jgi:hypothetical protein